MTQVLAKVLETSPDAWNTDIRDIRHVRRMHRFQAQPPMQLHTHGPSELDIIYLARGRQTHMINGMRYTMTGGDLILVRPGDIHSTGDDPEEKGLVYWVGIRWPPSKTSFAGLAEHLAKSLYVALATLIADRRITLFKGHAEMQRDLDATLSEADNTLHTVNVQTHITHFLLTVVKNATVQEHPHADWWSRKVKIFIEQKLGAHLDDNLLAHHFNLSKPWFVSRFKCEVGLPPMQYIQNRRIELARHKLIETPDRHITDIALDCGFACTQHFATVFKRYVGITPSNFRTQARKTSVTSWRVMTGTANRTVIDRKKYLTKVQI